MRRILTSRLFRILVCLLLIGCILINVSPLRVQATGVEAFVPVVVSFPSPIVVAGILIALGIGIGADKGVFDGVVSDCVSYLEGIGSSIGGTIDGLIQNGKSYFDQSLIETIRAWLFDSKVVFPTSFGSVIPADTLIFNSSSLAIKCASDSTLFKFYSTKKLCGYYVLIADVESKFYYYNGSEWLSVPSTKVSNGSGFIYYYVLRDSGADSVFISSAISIYNAVSSTEILKAWKGEYNSELVDTYSTSLDLALGKISPKDEDIGTTYPEVLPFIIIVDVPETDPDPGEDPDEDPEEDPSDPTAPSKVPMDPTPPEYWPIKTPSEIPDDPDQDEWWSGDTDFEPETPPEELPESQPTTPSEEPEPSDPDPTVVTVPPEIEVPEPEPSLDPSPSEVPDPEPEPSLDPTPSESPDPEPEPEPEPEPSLDPTPSESPDPGPDPSEDPDVTEAPLPNPEPGVDPDPTENPDPSDEPVPEPEPEPGPSQDPGEEGDPEQDPEQNPEQNPTVDPGNLSDYFLDLKRYFPFCIPYDLFDFFRCLAADPVAPVIEWVIPLPGGETYPLEIDLSAFDSVAQLLRRLQLLLFCVGLAFKTRDLIKG